MNIRQRLCVLWWRVIERETQRGVAYRYARLWPDSGVHSDNQLDGRELIKQASLGLVE